MTLGELTVEEREGVEAYLRHLFRHPLHAVHHLCRSNGQMNMAFPLTFLRQGLHNLIAAMVRGSLCHLSTIVVPYPIHQEELVAHLQSQYAYGMCTLLRRQRCLLSCIGDIEVSGLFHL